MNKLSGLPAVDRLIKEPEIAGLIDQWGRQTIIDMLRSLQTQVRTSGDVPSWALDPSHYPAQSWQMDNRAHTMAEDIFDHGFAVDWMRKDLGIGLDAARELNARLPLTALVDQFYAQVQARGGGRWDTSSLIKLLRD